MGSTGEVDERGPAGDAPADGPGAPAGGADAGAPDPRRTGRVLDAGALKALAHPLRFQLLELLIEQGPSTASELGRRVGHSSGLTSYHLRELAKHGLIEEDSGRGTARDRWWRAVSGGWTLEGFWMLHQPDTEEAARFVLDEVVRGRMERLARWLRDAPRWGEEWARATPGMTARLRLTREELEALSRELVDVVDRFRTRQADRVRPEARPPGTALVTVQIDAFPVGDPPDDQTTSDDRAGDR